MSNLSDIAENIEVIKTAISQMAESCAELAGIQADLANHIKSQQYAVGHTDQDNINTLVSDLLLALSRKQHIEAIKAHRALTGALLKDSKSAIDKFYNTLAEYIP